jgi:hypothetical protein
MSRQLRAPIKTSAAVSACIVCLTIASMSRTGYWGGAAFFFQLDACSST